MNPKNERVSVVCSLCFQNLKINVVISRCCVVERWKKNVLRRVSHVQHDYFLPFKQSNCVFAALALWFLKIFAMDASILLGPSPTTHCLRLGDTAQVHHWEQLNFHGQVSQLCLWVPGKENRRIKHCYPQIISFRVAVRQEKSSKHPDPWRGVWSF